MAKAYIDYHILHPHANTTLKFDQNIDSAVILGENHSEIASSLSFLAMTLRKLFMSLRAKRSNLQAFRFQ